MSETKQWFSFKKFFTLKNSQRNNTNCRRSHSEKVELPFSKGLKKGIALMIHNAGNGHQPSKQ
jgi:hypothetical protein